MGVDRDLLLQMNRNRPAQDGPIRLTDVLRASQRPAEAFRRPKGRFLDEVEPAAVEWLWPLRIGLGRLTLISGDPSAGKSVMTLDLASRISTGVGWPDDPHRTFDPGGVVLMNVEDALNDTVVPRLKAAGADMTKIRAFEGIVINDPESGEEEDVQATLRDLKEINDEIDILQERCPVRALIVDPLSAFIGKTDAHRDNEVRSILAPLAKLAEERHIAVICVLHLNKGGAEKAIYRSLGSIGFVGAARSAWLVTRDRQDPSRRLMLSVKNNNAPDTDGLAYEIVGAGLSTNPAEDLPVVHWHADPVQMTADEALGRNQADTPQRSEAEEFLEAELSGGPVLYSEIEEARKAAGLSKRTVDRAKSDLGVESLKMGYQGQWYWRHPMYPGTGDIPT